MAVTKIILDKEEKTEKEELSKLVKNLKKNEQEKLYGFLQGMNFIKKR